MKKYFVTVALLALTACGNETSDQSAPAAVEPSASASAPAGNAALEAWLRSRYADMDTNLLYRSAETDLDGDGTPEVLAYVGGMGMCGTGGCPLHILKAEPGGFREVTVTSVTQLPVGVLDTDTNGWRDIWVTTYGGGAPQEIKKLAFDGTSYPSNPTVAPAETIEAPGGVLIEDEDLLPVPAAEG